MKVGENESRWRDVGDGDLFPGYCFGVHVGCDGEEQSGVWI